MPRQRYDDAVSRVQSAVDELTVRGLVDKIMLVDGTVLYAGRAQKSFSLQRASFGSHLLGGVKIIYKVEGEKWCNIVVNKRGGD